MSARRVDLEAVAQQIDTIYGRIDALATKAARADPQPVMQQLLEKLREADRAEGAVRIGRLAAINAALGEHLAELESRTGQCGPAHAIAARGSAEHPRDAGCASREH